MSIAMCDYWGRFLSSSSFSFFLDLYLICRKRQKSVLLVAGENSESELNSTK